MFSDQFTSEPTRPPLPLSMIDSVHLPSIEPLPNPGGVAVVAASSGCDGRNAPVYGAEAAVIGWAAESAKRVLEKLAPGRPEASVTVIPSGEVSCRVRFASTG